MAQRSFIQQKLEKFNESAIYEKMYKADRNKDFMKYTFQGEERVMAYDTRRNELEDRKRLYL